MSHISLDELSVLIGVISIHHNTKHSRPYIYIVEVQVGTQRAQNTKSSRRIQRVTD
jgi:hypothetical protein